jgi:type I restriction enzyme M protein
MRKSLGSKRQEVGEEDIKLITRTFGDFAAIEPYELDQDQDSNGDAKSTRGRPSSKAKKADKRTFGSKIFESHEFGYRRISIERPLRLSVQLSDERIATLRFASGRLNGVMQAVYEAFGSTWTDETYGDLSSVAAEVRALVKADFSDLKEKQVKELLAPKTWTTQLELLQKATALQGAIGQEVCDDFNAFEKTIKQALKKTGVKLDTTEKKQLTDALSWTNPDAAPVVKKVLKSKADPMYGDFAYQGQVVQFQPDSSLRDNEDVPLTAETARGANLDVVNETYFRKEVAPHVADAWIDGTKCDAKDGQVGIVGYEIPFNRHFYVYEPPRDLAEIDAELDALSAEIMEMLREVRA